MSAKEKPSEALLDTMKSEPTFEKWSNRYLKDKDQAKEFEAIYKKAKPSKKGD